MPRSMNPLRRPFVIAVVPAVLGLAGCEAVEEFVDARRPLTPHEAYAQALVDAGLGETALSRVWLREAEAALDDPRDVDLPFLEEGFIAPESPDAVGYRFSLTRGQTLTVRLQVEGEEDTRVFLDVMRLARDPADPPRPVQMDTVDGALVYEPFRDGDFLVRVQPELLRGGRYALMLTLDPALQFPVADHGMTAIQSFWGAPRDGGRRRHEGVDIFARRGTPVVASVSGYVTRTGDTNLGGKIVWLRDERQNRNLYYAHLDSQAVEPGDRVQVGDTLGFVGNTGNARTTPPHLHFGIYYRGQGAVNPSPFLRPPPGRLAQVEVDRTRYGQWVRIRDEGIRLRTSPSRGGVVALEIPRHTPARVLGGSGDWYRVALPDGTQGYVAARLTEELTDLESFVAQTETPVRALPARSSPRAEILPRGTEARVTGRFGDFLQVRTARGGLAWLEAPAASASQASAQDDQGP